MNILVTGAAGYIGSVVTEVLCNHRHDVTVWDSLMNGHRDAIDGRARFECVDLLDAEKVHAGLKMLRPDAVVHLAAEALIDESMRDPGRFYRANLVGGIHLLDSMVASGIRRLVFSSTAAVYGQPNHVPITEEMAGDPCNSYGESKWAFERALQWYESAHGLRHISFRYFNACGATENHGEDHRPETHIIPLLFATALGQRGTFQLYGSDYDTPDGTCIRDYVHVADIAEAHRMALERIDSLDSGRFNLGLARGYSNREVIAAVEKVTGLKIPVKQSARRPGDPAILVADPSFAHRILDWNPGYSDLEAMIVTAWNWRREHPEGYGI
jgi:UDP-glucose 4-epimerase